MKVRITELIENGEKLKDLGETETDQIPNVGDKFYFYGVEQYTVLERHFILPTKGTIPRYDVELFVQTTASIHKDKMEPEK